MVNEKKLEDIVVVDVDKEDEGFGVDKLVVVNGIVLFFFVDIKMIWFILV